MKLARYLASRGLREQVIEDLLPFIHRKMPEASSGAFYDAANIMDPERWFSWPGQTRFVLVGQCANGDGVAIDSQKEPGAVFYVAHELVDSKRPLEEVVIRVAESPSHYVQGLLAEDFPYDYWDARARGTEPTASPNRRPARRRAMRTPRRGGGR
jgi:hypothetical protein